MVLQEKKVGEKHYTTVDMNKYGDIPPIDTTLIWPTLETEIPLTTPPKGRPKQKRPLISPDNTPFTTVKSKKRKTKKNLNAESSISDKAHDTSEDEDTSEVQRIHKIITGKQAKKSLTKEDLKKK